MNALIAKAAYRRLSNRLTIQDLQVQYVQVYGPLYGV
jgi:hypothetical protein